jgi:hypothetical protein
MSDHKTHDQHSHVHGSGCGHTAVQHEGHVDYLHDGHLHSAHQGHVDEHVLAEAARILQPAPQVMRVVHMTPSTLTGLVADMKRFRTAVIPTIWWRATSIMHIRDTAMITASFRPRF